MRAASVLVLALSALSSASGNVVSRNVEDITFQLNIPAQLTPGVEAMTALTQHVKESLLEELRKELTQHVKESLLEELRKELKNKAFDVFRDEPWRQDGTITYTGSAVDTTEGAISPSTGIFTAPEDGVFRFIFMGNFRFPSGKDGHGWLKLKKNDQTVATSGENPPSDDEMGYTTITLNSIVQLAQGDKVWMEWTGYSGAYLFSSSDNKYLHFTGEKLSSV